MALRHVRRHWKKYVAGQCIGVFVTSYFIRKHRERNVVREYCYAAKRFGEEKAGMLEKPKKIMVFLNRTANDSNAKIHFTKYAAPLLYLSGLDITVVESQYQGHLQMLMHYVDPKTDMVVIAGGDGTVMEVLNGIMRRPDMDKVVKTMTFGILPLGKENRSFKSLFPSSGGASQARRVGEATMKVLHGLTKQVSVMEIQPEKGNPLFGLSSIQWGVFTDAFQNKNRFWVFGKMRLLASYLSTAIRRWPGETFPSSWQFCNMSEPGAEASQSEAADREQGTAAFRVCPAMASGGDSLLLTTWPLSHLSKSAFLKHGCKRTFQPGHSEEMPGEERSGSEFRVQAPAEGCGIQVCVDGEEYEPVDMQVRLKPDYITMFT